MQAAGLGAGAMAAAPLLATATAGVASADTGGVTAHPAPAAAPVVTPPVATGPFLTSDQGLRISDDLHSLKVSDRGPTLLEDFLFREKLTHFDHERIPERVVHARGAGAHGVFRLTKSLSGFTRAKVLTDTSASTEVFVRFSTVNGSRGSADTARDARGFATKFYTSEGVWDLVGNNIPVFFIQDAIKFPDLVHAFKPEPLVELPQASTAHNNFWDYVSLTPESMHMIMWIMSDRAIPRSFRMMEGFGIHTWRLVNSAGVSTYAKFHWKPQLGVHSLVWDEAQKLGGVDPDFHRRDLATAIDEGHFPQWDFGVQLLREADVPKLGIDILDATKLWPEEIVPVTRVGQLTLNRNPYNYFAETEQVAFCASHVVPGIDFTDDPLLQGRLFSYLDTQLGRFHSANFHQLPINQSRSAVNNYQQDGFMRYENRPGNINFEPSSQTTNAAQPTAAQGGFVTYPEVLSGPKLRAQPISFGDHFSQATLFYRSMSAPEKQHIISALRFELGRVTIVPIKQRMLGLLANIDSGLVSEVASGLGLPVPSGHVDSSAGRSPALSQLHTAKSAVSRRVAVVTSDGADGADLKAMVAALSAAGVDADIIAPHEGSITTTTGPVTVAYSLLTVRSVQYDALYLPGGGPATTALSTNGDALHFIEETYKHYKTIAASGTGEALLRAALPGPGSLLVQPGVLSGATAGALSTAFVAAIATDRHWSRQFTDRIPA